MDSTLYPRVIWKYGMIRKVLVLGFGWVALFQTATTPYGIIVLQMLLLGSGLGLSTAPATESILSVVRPEQVGVGSAVNDATRLVGGTLGVAIIGQRLRQPLPGPHRRHGPGCPLQSAPPPGTATPPPGPSPQACPHPPGACSPAPPTPGSSPACTPAAASAPSSLYVAFVKAVTLVDRRKSA